MEPTLDGFAKNSMLLSSLSEDERNVLLSVANQCRFSAGTTIFSCAEPGETLLLIRSGRVEVSVTSLTGRKSVLNHMGPGEVLGEIALLDGGARSADVVAATDVEALVLHRRDVASFLQDRPRAMMATIAELCGKVRNASDMFATQAETEAPSRLARCLLRLVEKWGTGPEGAQLAEFSQTDLGEFSGISRENVNRRLKAWEAAGLVELSPQGIILRDLDALAEIGQL